LQAVHVLVKEKEQLIGYSRILKKGVSYQKYSSIGRVVVKKEKRKKSIGIKLMEFSIKTCKDLHPNETIKISAQTYLKKFYEKQGFIQKGENYMEDGIPHCAMYLEEY
jgi:ElaA protein